MSVILELYGRKFPTLARNTYNNLGYRMKGTLVTLLLITLTLSLHAQSTNSKYVPKELTGTKVYGPEYFPLNRNAEYVFESNVGETQSRIVMNNEGYVVSNEGEDFGYKQTFVKKDDGIYLTKTTNKISVFLFSTNDTITYDKPVLRLPMPMRAGQSWEWHGHDIVDGEMNQLSMYGKVIGEEKIETEAGTFDALKIELKVDSKDGTDSVLYEWLAPGIGVVKTQLKMEGGGITWIIQKILGYDQLNFRLANIN